MTLKLKWHQSKKKQKDAHVQKSKIKIFCWRFGDAKRQQI